jgi:hypothetical protein
MNAIIIHPEWALAKRMAGEWHPIGQFMLFVDGTKLPWFGLVADGFDIAHEHTISAFGKFCARWQPELEKRGIKIAEPPEDL